MAKPTTMEPTASETAALLAEIEQAFAEMDLLREQMRRDSREIERCRARTQAVLERSRNGMLTTIEGTYQNGRITLLERPEGVGEGRVLVTFLNDGGSKPPHQQMVFGQFAGDVLPTEEDFKIAEWHGEEEFDELDGG